MARSSSDATAPRRRPAPLLARESLYVGSDVGKRQHVAGFVSRTLLGRHERVEGRPALTFENTRDGFRALVERLETCTPHEQVLVLMEQTGHDHHALLQYLLDLDIAVHLSPVQERTAGLLKTDKRDALGLANRRYTQLERGAQVADKAQLVRRAVPPLEAAARLRGLVRHRDELVHEATRRKNKLTAIGDELFRAFATLFKDPNAAGALAWRVGAHPSTVKLRQRQAVAATSIGVHDLGRQRGLVLEQRQFIREVRLLQTHSEELDAEIRSIVASSREGRMLTSLPLSGPLQAATILVAIGHSDNFASAAALRAYCGWAPQVKRSGETVDQVKLTRGGTRTMKQTLYLVVANAIQRPECAWARLYHRLAPRKCSYDERRQRSIGSAPSAALHRQRSIGTNKVLARIAGQLSSTIDALLKRAAEALAQYAPGRLPPEPVLYDPALHKAHREGHYRSSKPQRSHSIIVALPTRTGK